MNIQIPRVTLVEEQTDEHPDSNGVRGSEPYFNGSFVVHIFHYSNPKPGLHSFKGRDPNFLVETNF